MPLAERSIAQGILWLMLVLIHHRIPVAHGGFDAFLDLTLNLLGAALILAGLLELRRL